MTAPLRHLQRQCAQRAAAGQAGDPALLQVAVRLRIVLFAEQNGVSPGDVRQGRGQRRAAPEQQGGGEVKAHGTGY
jgi:hypothetical protein